jgi:single-strand DNA-binding protein
MNRYDAIGRLTADPQADETRQGTSVAKMRLAVPRRRGREREDRGAVFVELVAYGGLADIANTHLRKGRQVAISSRLEQDEWTTDDGQPRSKLYLVAEEIEFLDKPSDHDGAERDDEPVAQAS